MLNGIDISQVRNIITGITPAVSVAVSPTSTAHQGSNVTLTATTPTGIGGVVQFRSGNTLVGTVTASAGSAALAVTTLPLGIQQLTCRFIPNDRLRYRPSISPAVSHTIILVLLSDIILTNLITDLDLARATLSSRTNAAAITSLTPGGGSEVGALTQATATKQMAYLVDEGDGSPR